MRLGEGHSERQRIAALLRAEADGEIDAAGAAELDAAGVTAREDRIEGERALRAATARVMSNIRTPPGLRDEVLRALRGGVVPRDVRVMRAGLAARLRLVGMAAVLAICVTGVWMAARYAMPRQDPPDLAVRAATVAMGEHVRSASDVVYAEKSKSRIRDVSEIASFCRERLGRAPSIDWLVRQGEFLGGGPCALPGRGEVVHLRFLAKAACGHTEHFSLFIQRDTGDMRFPVEGESSVVACGGSGEQVTVWRRDGLVHFLVSADAELVRCLVRARYSD